MLGLRMQYCITYLPIGYQMWSRRIFLSRTGVLHSVTSVLGLNTTEPCFSQISVDINVSKIMCSNLISISAINQIDRLNLNILIVAMYRKVR